MELANSRILEVQTTPPLPPPARLGSSFVASPAGSRTRRSPRRTSQCVPWRGSVPIHRALPPTVSLSGDRGLEPVGLSSSLTPGSLPLSPAATTLQWEITMGTELFWGLGSAFWWHRGSASPLLFPSEKWPGSPQLAPCLPPWVIGGETPRCEVLAPFWSACYIATTTDRA